MLRYSKVRPLFEHGDDVAEECRGYVPWLRKNKFKGGVKDRRRVCIRCNPDASTDNKDADACPEKLAVKGEKAVGQCVHEERSGCKTVGITEVEDGAEQLEHEKEMFKKM